MNLRWKIGIAGVIFLAFCAGISFWRIYKTENLLKERDSDIEAIRAKAEQGDIQAEFRLGSMYGSGHGTPKDYSLALRWYLAAAEKGDSKSEYGAGYLYATGKGVQQNLSEALRWWQKAADQNNPRAQDAIGDAYYNGKGVERDWIKAAQWYRRAAENGLPQGQYDLGYMLYYGQGVTQDRAEARRWFREALKKGDERARGWLGYKLTAGRIVFLVIQTLFGMAFAFRPWSLNIWEPNMVPRAVSSWVSVFAGWTCLINAGIGWWGYTHNLFWNWSYGLTGLMVCKAILDVIVGVLIVAVLAISQKKVAHDSEIPMVRENNRLLGNSQQEANVGIFARCRVLHVTTSRKQFVIAALAALIFLIGFVVFYRSNYPAPPPFKVAPLPRNAPALTAAEVEQILSANFILIRRVQQVPAAVKADYATLANQPFEMVNPGQTRSTDAIIRGVPNKELVFVGLADSCAVLIFRRGGLWDTTNVAVFSHRGTGGVWTARIDDNGVQDIATLRNAVHNRRFEPWDADFLFGHPPE